LDLLLPAELGDLAVGAGRDALVLLAVGGGEGLVEHRADAEGEGDALEVLLEGNEGGHIPALGAEVAAEVAH
jgi:hypothetical protein